jgi:hypothetical protein
MSKDQSAASAAAADGHQRRPRELPENLVAALRGTQSSQELLRLRLQNLRQTKEALDWPGMSLRIDLLQAELAHLDGGNTRHHDSI